MKIYTIYSESHEHLFDIMKESIVNCNCSLYSKKSPQVCKSGNYGSGDAINFYYLKILYILELLHTETEPFVFADVDMYFFRDFSDDLKDRLKDNDMLIQFEKNVFGLSATSCNGFMYLRPNREMQKAFHWVLKNLHRFKGDQQALNGYAYTHQTNWDLLPKTYYSINYDNGNKVWDGEDIKITVQEPYLFHYHWTIGNTNKVKLLEMVKGQV